MAERGLFAPQAEGVVREALARMKRMAQSRYEDETRLAIDYLEGRQVEDVRGELQTRYQKTQAGGPGQDIQPFTVPLTQRYVAEAASCYNRPVLRKVVSKETGKTDEDSTKIVTDHLAACNYDERMHKVEQITTLVKSCGLWYQVKRGKLRPVVTYPDCVHTVSPMSADYFDPADPEDYFGFIVRLAYGAQEDTLEGTQFVLLTHAETVFYSTRDGDPYSMPENVRKYRNVFMWPQAVDTEDMRGDEQLLPLQPLTIWNRELSIDCLMHECDSDIVNANREINVALSMLFDAIRTQSWSVAVMNLINPEMAPAKMAWGPRFPITLMKDEEFSLVNAATPYQEIVSALGQVAKLLAIAHRQSPNDFSTDQTSALSGFAKLVDSLPKLEARAEAAGRFKKQEEQQAWPRIASALVYLGALPSSIAETHRLETEFAPLEFPKSVDEESKQNEADVKMNLTTPAKILAKRKGISLEQAEKEIEENRGKNETQAPKPEPVFGGEGGGFGKPSRLGSRVGRRSSQDENKQEPSK